MGDGAPGWLGLTEGLIMIGAAGVAAVPAYLGDAGNGTILAVAVIAAVAAKFIYRQLKSRD